MFFCQICWDSKFTSFHLGFCHTSQCKVFDLNNEMNVCLTGIVFWWVRVRVFVSNKVLKYIFCYHRVLVVGANFLLCHVPDPTTEQKSHFTILRWPCKRSKNKNNISILKKFLFRFHTQFLFFLLSVSGLIFHGARPYNWWIHKKANIEPTNYALLFWLVYF